MSFLFCKNSKIEGQFLKFRNITFSIQNIFFHQLSPIIPLLQTISHFLHSSNTHVVQKPAVLYYSKPVLVNNIPEVRFLKTFSNSPDALSAATLMSLSWIYKQINIDY